MMKQYNRRRFLTSVLTTGIAALTWRPQLTRGTSPTITTQLDPKGFFTLGQRKGHWWLTTPEGTPFFSMGLIRVQNDFSAKQSCFYWTIADMSIDEWIHINR